VEIGAALNSFGAECALMAGVPDAVVERAAVIARAADRAGSDQFVIDSVHKLASVLESDEADADAVAELAASTQHILQHRNNKSFN